MGSRGVGIGGRGKRRQRSLILAGWRVARPTKVRNDGQGCCFVPSPPPRPLKQTHFRLASSGDALWDWLASSRTPDAFHKLRFRIPAVVN